MLEPSDSGVMELDLRAYLRALRRRHRLVVLTTLAVFALAVGWSLFQSPRYEARARVLIAVDSQPSLFNAPPPVADPNRVVQTELLAFDSPQLRDRVRRRVGVAPRISVRQVGFTDAVELVAGGPTGQQAARVANAYAEAYIDLRREETVHSVVSAAEQLQAKVSELQRQIDATAGDEQRSLIDQQSLFRQKLDQLEVDGALRQGTARLVSQASVPSSPVAPDRVRIAVVALVFGLLTGVGLALAVEYLDDSLRSVEDVERAAPGWTVVGVIPDFEDGPAWRERRDRPRPGEPQVVSLRAPLSPAAEAVRTLRTALDFLSLERAVYVLHVTSPGIGEGKSSIVANLGVALARTGRRVVLVDCDLRRPRLHDLLGVSAEAGLTSVLAGDAPLDDALRPVGVQEGLFVVPAGPHSTDPAELLASARMADVVQGLRAQSDIVLLDSPPVLPVADALITAPLADASLVVCRAGRSGAKQLGRTFALLTQVHAKVAGIVLNAVPGHETYGSPSAYYGPGADAGIVTRRGAP